MEGGSGGGKWRREVEGRGRRRNWREKVEGEVEVYKCGRNSVVGVRGEEWEGGGGA